MEGREGVGHNPLGVVDEIYIYRNRPTTRPAGAVAPVKGVSPAFADRPNGLFLDYENFMRIRSVPNGVA